MRILDGKNDLGKNGPANIWTHILKDLQLKKILSNTHGYEPYKKASFLICNALKNYDLSDKTIAIIGSTSPWIEAI